MPICKDSYQCVLLLHIRKICTKCHKPKLLKDFSKAPTYRYGRRSDCRACGNARGAAWRAGHVEHSRAQHHEYRTNNSQRIKVSDRLYRKTKTGRANNRRACLRYYQTHKADYADRGSRRRARIKNAPVVERINRLQVYERDGGKCHICHKTVPIDRFTLDHLIPLIHGGTHTYGNLAVAHVSCNGRRGAGRLPAQLRLF